MLERYIPSFRDELEKIAAEEGSALREYMRHAALNLGQAARDARYIADHPHADKIAPKGSAHHMAASVTARIPSLTSNLYYAALPPRLHHTKEELKDTDKATIKEWFLHGYAPWKHKVSASMEKRVESHHQAHDKNWGEYEKNMRSPRFTAEVLKSPLSDEKLKAYTKANNQYLRSKNVVAEIPSRSGGSPYKVKKLSSGRFGCSCKDWQYKKSWQGSDCDHIQAAKKGMEKRASIARGLSLGWHVQQAKTQARKGKAISANVSALNRSMTGTG